jgi:hypothetical protein
MDSLPFTGKKFAGKKLTGDEGMVNCDNKPLGDDCFSSLTIGGLSIPLLPQALLEVSGLGTGMPAGVRNPVPSP